MEVSDFRLSADQMRMLVIRKDQDRVDRIDARMSAAAKVMRLRRELQRAAAFFNPAALSLSDLPEQFEEAEEELRILEETPWP